jgi:hypothetical protein
MDRLNPAGPGTNSTLPARQTVKGGMDVHADNRLALERQQTLLTRAQHHRQASRLRALRRASRRAVKAADRLSQARSEVSRMRAEFDAAS